jgi:hypothetical protein
MGQLVIFSVSLNYPKELFDVYLLSLLLLQFNIPELLIFH